MGPDLSKKEFILLTLNSAARRVWMAKLTERLTNHISDGNMRIAVVDNLSDGCFARVRRLFAEGG